MTDLSTIQTLKNQLIRKSLDMSVFIGAMSVAAINATTLFNATTGALATLPTGMTDLGFLTNAGAQFARAVTESNVQSAQSLPPTRSDTTEDTITLQVSCQETKLATIGLGTGADPAGITAATNGMVRIDKPAAPSGRHYRVFAIGEDLTDDGPIYVCRYLPKGKVTAYEQQNIAKQDDPIMWGVTFTGFIDSTVGTDHSWIFGGEGWLARKADMGF